MSADLHEHVLLKLNREIDLDSLLRSVVYSMPFRLILTCDFRKPYGEQLSDLESWDFMTLMGFAMVSTYGRIMAARVLEAKRTSFLHRFIRDVGQLVQVMRDTRAVLGGSACLAILQSTARWVPGDLDIFCPRDGYETFCIYIVDKLGGKVIQHHDIEDIRRHRPDDCPEGVCDRRLIRTSSITFDVMCSNTLAATEPVANSFSTHLMNFIGADSICIAYPWLFGDRICVMKPVEGYDHSVHMGKYIERGYRIQAGLQDASSYRLQERCPSNGHCCRALRYFGDSNCLSMTFSYPHSLVTLHTPIHLPPFGTPSLDLAWTTAWVWGGNPCNRGTCILRTDSCVHAVVLCDAHRLV